MIVSSGPPKETFFFFFNIQGCKYEENIKICMIGKIKSCDEKPENLSLK